MKQICLKITIELRSDTIISSGHSIPGGENIALRLDRDGLPFLPGSTLKGLLRESVENLLVWEGGDEALLGALFGTPNDGTADERKLVFGPMRLEKNGQWRTMRAFTAISANGVAEPKTLRVAACLRKGQRLSGILLCAQEDAALVRRGLAAIKWIGLMRNRGFGCVKITADLMGDNQRKTAEAAPYLYYRLQLEAPLTVGDLHGNRGQEERKNHSDTRNYLPGTAVRGFVMSRLAAEKPEWFAAHRQELLSSRVRFFNALPRFEDVSVLPTPCGFYEDKAQTRLYHKLDDKVKPGDKEAKLGAFCVLRNKEICSGSPPLTKTLRIRRGEEKQVFTTMALAPGTILEGYIQLADASLVPTIAATFSEFISLGADRFAGSGLSKVLKLEGVCEPHWAAMSITAGQAIPKEFDMLLLSPMAMCKDGELVGIDEEQLADRLGVETVEISGCATTLTELHGFNRTWGCETPMTPMYGIGSLFRLNCASVPDVEKLRAVEHSGLGLYTAEGFGRVLFINARKEISKKSRLLDPAAKNPDGAALVRQKKSQWLYEHAGDLSTGLSKSQLGNVQAVCEQAIANGGELKYIEEFFKQKKVEPKQRAAYAKLFDKMQEIWNTPVPQTFGVDFCEDSLRIRLEILVELLNLCRKEGNAQ